MSFKKILLVPLRSCDAQRTSWRKEESQPQFTVSLIERLTQSAEGRQVAQA